MRRCSWSPPHAQQSGVLCGTIQVLLFDFTGFSLEKISFFHPHIYWLSKRLILRLMEMHWFTQLKTNARIFLLGKKRDTKVNGCSSRQRTDRVSNKIRRRPWVIPRCQLNLCLYRPSIREDTKRSVEPTKNEEGSDHATAIRGRKDDRAWHKHFSGLRCWRLGRLRWFCKFCIVKKKARLYRAKC